MKSKISFANSDKEKKRIGKRKRTTRQNNNKLITTRGKIVKMGEFLWLPGFRTKAILRVRVTRVSLHAQRLSGGQACVRPCKRVCACVCECLRVLTRVCVRARTRVRASGLKLMGGWFKAYGRVLFWHWTRAGVRIYKHAEIWIYHLEAMSGQWQPLHDESFWNLDFGLS